MTHFPHFELTRILTLLKDNGIATGSETVKLCCTELTYKEKIASTMDVSHRTVDGYRDELFKKLGIHSRTGLVMYAIKNKIVKIDS